MNETRFSQSQRWRRLSMLFAAIGGVGFLAGVVTVPDSAWAHLLLVGFLGVGLGLSGALFVALQYVTRAGWSIALRRVPEAMTWLLPIGGALVLLALAAYPPLYPWTAEDYHPHSPFKHVWLNRPFFLVRAVIYLAIWMGLAFVMVRNSRRQDEDGSLAHTHSNARWAPLFLVVFGVTIWLASYDWIMSREPDWLSTIFGVYNFAGLFTAGLAFTILCVLWLRRHGPYRQILSEDHLHDLGKLLFGMSIFWAYIWYCQYMLIWYVNNPEETPYYLRRLEGVYEPLMYLNVFLNWVVPFFALMMRSSKRSAKVLINVSIAVLVGRWLDVYLMVLPADTTFLSIVTALAMTVGAIGVYVLGFGFGFAQAAAVPVHDPYLVESLPHHAPVAEVSR
jgi:hypothetical protein